MATTESRTRVDVPVGVDDAAGRPAWGSDLVMDMLRLLDVEYAAILPGSSFRGIHDSAVNYTANRRPQLVLCNHEMITVSLARGYAKVTGRPMAAIVHDFVGLLNAAMTIYDAWCDRVPVLILGGTGPMDATKRRPWIDWIHTANLQGVAVRDFTKWDDQPSSVAAIPDSLLRAHRIATTEPAGPVYVCFDVSHQEEAITEPIPLPDAARFRAAPPPAPDAGALREAARLLVEAELPLCLADRVGRSAEAVRQLVELAELLAMPVVNLGTRHSFPTPHLLDFAGLARELSAEADVVLGLEPVDLGGSLRPMTNAAGRSAPDRSGRVQRVINVSLDELIHRALTTDYQALPAVDVPILSDSAATLPYLIEECRSRINDAARVRIERRRQALAPRQEQMRERQRRQVDAHLRQPGITEARLATAVWGAVKDEDFVFTSGRLSRMAPGVCAIPGPERNVGGGGGGAVGAGPGAALGAALALQDTGKLPVAVLGDGEFLSSIQALWTAAHHGIPSLWVINNNRSYYNDEAHQKHIAQVRERPLENAWVAQRIQNPEIDYASVARDFGVGGEGPITDPADLEPALRRAVEEAKRGQLVVVDVRTETREEA
ncbi:MAG TPA: thiamine pyrophosphate-binding protein [Chloroflexota bacterium]|nr:thiamine pyrophosphate-binding protein [Chloroflexota bacterium]